MRGKMGRGVIVPLIPLGITVECYYIVNGNNHGEYLVYFPKKYRNEFRGYGKTCFDSDPVERYYSDDPAHRNFLILSSKFGIKSPEYTGFYSYRGDFEKYVRPLAPPVLQGDSL